MGRGAAGRQQLIVLQRKVRLRFSIRNASSRPANPTPPQARTAGPMSLPRAGRPQPPNSVEVSLP